MAGINCAAASDAKLADVAADSASAISRGDNRAVALLAVVLDK